jgi:hypothetical protein
LIDDDVEPVIFHRRVKIFLNRRLEPMDFIDEKDIAFFQAGEKPSELAGSFNHRSAGIFDIHAHRVRNDVSERGLAQTGRTAQQNVLEHIAPFFRRFHHQFQAFTHLHLTGEFAEHRWPQ